MSRRVLAGICLAFAACDSPPADPPDPDARPAPADAAPADAAPAEFHVQYVDPDHGPFTGGTEVLVRGNLFAADDEVWIGGRRVLAQDFIDDRRIKVWTPPGEPGAATVEVRKPSGEVAADAFRFDALAVDPPTGSIAGNTFVTITGWDTDFGPGTVVRLDGVPLTAVEVRGPTELTGFTPPGTVGDADLAVTTEGGVHEAERAYTYVTTGDPFAGGFSGPPIDGALDVVVLDSWTGDGIPGATVVVGDPATSPHQGTTDALGQITFAGPDLAGPVTVTATAAGFEVASFHCFDASHLTVFLRSPTPPPDDTGPPGVGVADGWIRGHVVFGGPTGQGSPFWSLVPEPRTPSEVKRIYVTTSGPTIFGSPRPPVAPIDYVYDPDQLAWPFEVRSRPGAFAVVAVAGLYDPARDPGDTGVLGFEPFALGVTRAILVGPGEDVANVDVLVDIPLDATARVILDAPPPLGVDGPLEYRVRGFVELGADGAISFGRHGLPLLAGEPMPGEVVLPPGATEALIAHAPPRFSTIASASYTFQVGAYTAGASPFSIRYVRGVDALGALRVGDFLGVPRPVDPPADGVGTGGRVEFAPEALDREPTFHMHMLHTETGDPVWRGITCGSLHAIELPDLSAHGFAWPPAGQRLVWTITSVDATTDDYNQWTYRWLGASSWDAYAADAVFVTFP